MLAEQCGVCLFTLLFTLLPHPLRQDLAIQITVTSDSDPLATSSRNVGVHHHSWPWNRYFLVTGQLAPLPVSYFWALETTYLTLRAIQPKQNDFCLMNETFE